MEVRGSGNCILPDQGRLPTPSSAGPLELELPATPTSVTNRAPRRRRVCAGQVLGHGALALAVMHAYCDGEPGLVYVAASLDDGTLAVVISDDG